MTGRLNWSAFRNSGCTAVYCLQKQTKETMGTKKRHEDFFAIEGPDSCKGYLLTGPNRLTSAPGMWLA